MQEQTQIPQDIEDRIINSAEVHAAKYGVQTSTGLDTDPYIEAGYICGAKAEYIAYIQRERDTIMLFVEHLDTHYLQDTVNMDVWFDRVTGNPKTREQVYEIYLSLSIENK
jgi:hypothetical protein